MRTVGPFSATFRWRRKPYVLFVSELLSCRHGNAHIGVYRLDTQERCDAWCCVQAASWPKNRREWLLFGQSLKGKMQAAIINVQVQKAMTALSIPEGETVFWI